MAITTIGSHEAWVSASVLVVVTEFVAIIVDDTNYRQVVAATPYYSLQTDSVTY
jgi:plasmid replication initiation protein